jgi:hypothetical protein
MINFRNCSHETLLTLNVIIDAVSKAMYLYGRTPEARSAYDVLVVFVGRKQWGALIQINPFDKYGLGDGRTFMTQKVVRVFEDDYLAVAVKADAELHGG